MTEIQMIPIEEIQHHPEESKIYGPVEVGNDFIASVKDSGVLQPIILCDIKIMEKDLREKGKKYFLVSGHRRKVGAELAGLKEIPAMIRSYKSYDETTLHLCVTNKNREKTEAQRRREFLLLKQILCQLGKIRMGSGIWDNTGYDDDELSRFLETLKIDEEKPLDSIEILKLSTGYSEYEQRLIQTVCDVNYMEKQLSKLRKLKISPKAEGELVEVWTNWSELYEKGKKTLKQAYDAIRSELDKIEKRLNPVKKEKSKKEKPEKDEPEFDVNTILDMLFEEDKIKEPLIAVYKSNASDSEFGYVTNDKNVVGVWIGNAKTKTKHRLNVVALANLYEAWQQGDI